MKKAKPPGLNKYPKFIQDLIANLCMQGAVFQKDSNRHNQHYTVSYELDNFVIGISTTTPAVYNLDEIGNSTYSISVRKKNTVVFNSFFISDYETAISLILKAMNNLKK